MENGQCIEEHIQQMRDSECMVSAFHDSRRGEDVNDGHCGYQENSRDSCQCLEEPIGNGRQKIGAEDCLKWMKHLFNFIVKLPGQRTSWKRQASPSWLCVATW